MVVCNGMPRSASTWSFNVAVRLLRETQPGRVHGGYDESTLAFLIRLPRGARHAVLKCHGLDEFGRALASSRTARVIYTWREPADAVASAMRMFSWDFDRAYASIEGSLCLYEFHRETRNVLIVDYSEIVDAPAVAIERVADYLELDVSRDLLRDVARATSIDEMRAKAESIEGVDVMSHDPESLLHPGHIRHGGSYGCDVLSADQLVAVKAMAARFGLGT
jgi:hypothetical protein